MYYFALIVLLFFVLSKKGKINKKSFTVVFLLLSGIACFRYGQGSDYFNYANLYDSVVFYWEVEPLSLLVISDPGYALLNVVVAKLGISYVVFMAVFTAVMMWYFYIFLSKRCHYSFYSLFFFFCFIYMIYVLSVVRQGFCIAFFYSYIYPKLKQKKYRSYILSTVLLCTIHLSSILLLLFPIVLKLHPSERMIKIGFYISFGLLIFSSSVLSRIPIGIIQERLSHYHAEASSNMILAKILRCIFVIPLLFIPRKLLRDSEIYDCRLLLFLGFFIYSAFSFSELTSSRLWGYFWGFDCIIISRLQMFFRNFKYSRYFVRSFIVIGIVFWLKDINAAINQGKYEHCNMFSYPYVSVFEDESTISYYRKSLSMVDD